MENEEDINDLEARRYYACDEKALHELQQSKPWMKNTGSTSTTSTASSAAAKYFTKVAISPSAIMKMMMHCDSGVTKGIAQGGNPIEVMGLLLGRPDPVEPTQLIVCDAFPLPIEGFETRVIADDQAVVNHMISLNESLERSRKEKFMGWYHSHPFEDTGTNASEDYSHCFLSQTDLSTQLQWQRAEDPHGNPFVAIVLDPIRSTRSGLPQAKAFRAFPPEYSNPIPNQCPDGTIVPSEQVRLERWGSCWNRYYELEIVYYMSPISRQVLEQLTQKYLWMTHFKTTNTTGTKTSASGGGSGSANPHAAAITLKLAQIQANLKHHPHNHHHAASAQQREHVVETSTSTAVAGAAIPAATIMVGAGTASTTGSIGSGNPGATSTMTTFAKDWQSQVMVPLEQLATQELAQSTLQQVQQHVFTSTSSK